MRRPAIPFILLILLSACGGSITKHADKSLASSLAAARAAREAFVDYDRDHQMAIVDDATSREEGEANLRAYRAQRAHVMRAFTAVYSSISAAAALVPLVERGEKKDADLRAALFEVMRAVIEMKNAIDQVRSGR
jgi:hypothetical protein